MRSRHASSSALRALAVIASAVSASAAPFSATSRAEPGAPIAAEAPPFEARPALGDFAQRAELLFEAIVHDDAQRAREVFFPREPFLQIKAIPNPGRYYDKLHARFLQDVHTLHETLGQDARFERFELSRRGGYVRPGEEGNRLPYWAARHCFLHYRQGDQLKKFEVRVLITWQARWYVIHLSEFH